MKNLLLLLLILVSGSCKTQERNKPETARIELTKTVCYGTCPDYTFTLDISGKATYYGRTHVTKTGVFEKTFTREEVRAIIDLFEKSNFWGFQDKYINEGVSDMPSVYLTFEHNGKQKKIEDQFGSPKELKELQKKVEEMANSEGWKEAKP